MAEDRLSEIDSDGSPEEPTPLLPGVAESGTPPSEIPSTKEFCPFPQERDELERLLKRTSLVLRSWLVGSLIICLAAMVYGKELNAGTWQAIACMAILCTAAGTL